MLFAVTGMVDKMAFHDSQKKIDSSILNRVISRTCELMKCLKSQLMMRVNWLVIEQGEKLLDYTFYCDLGS